MSLSSGNWKFKIRMSSMPRSGISAGLHTPISSHGQRALISFLVAPLSWLNWLFKVFTNKYHHLWWLGFQHMDFKRDTNIQIKPPAQNRPQLYIGHRSSVLHSSPVKPWTCMCPVFPLRLLTTCFARIVVICWMSTGYHAPYTYACIITCLECKFYLFYFLIIKLKQRYLITCSVSHGATF